MKVTTKGQVTIPVRIRGYLGIVPPAEVDFAVLGGQVVLTKATEPTENGRGRFASMRGIASGRLTTDEWMKATRGD